MMIFFLLNNSTESRIKAAGVALAVGKKKGVERDGERNTVTAKNQA